METKANPNPNGCLARALPDEPFLVLLARDLAAPKTIRFWAEERAQMGIEEVHEQDAEQLSEALETAEAMEAWRARNEGAWRGAPPTPLEPFEPSEEATSRAGHILAFDPLDSKRVAQAVADKLATFGFSLASPDPLNPLQLHEVVAAALVAGLSDYVNNAQSLAGLVLRLDKRAGQGDDARG